MAKATTTTTSKPAAASSTGTAVIIQDLVKQTDDRAVPLWKDRVGRHDSVARAKTAMGKIDIAGVYRVARVHPAVRLTISNKPVVSMEPAGKL